MIRINRSCFITYTEILLNAEPVSYTHLSTRWPEYDVRCKGGCSSCQALLAINMEELKAVGAYDENAGMTVVIGGLNEIPEDIPDEKIVLHGNCTRKYLKQHPGAYHISVSYTHLCP